MFTLMFWRDALERALSTAAQAALLAIGADQLDVLTGDWIAILGFTVGGFVLSILKSIGATRLGNRDSASLTD